MIFASVCSGIEAASAAWLPLGWQCAFVAEIEKFPCAVLKHHYPDTPNYGDITRFKDWPVQPIDVLIGGTPCQSFSVAGLRKGLADPRGNLALTFLAIAERFAPTVIVWENVLGVLSSDEGRAFGAFLGGLGQLGYGFAYAVLDAQYFGLAQRRKRVFVVGHSGGQWQRAATVLFDRESLCGNPPPRRETRERLAPSLAARTRGGGGLGTDAECDGGVIPIQEIGKRQSGTPMNGVGYGQPGDPMYTLQSNVQHGIAHSLKADGFDAKGADSDTKEGHLLPVAEPVQVQWASGGGQLENPTAQALRSGAEHSYQFTRHGMAVRRLTPKECERLQGFPDDYTLLPGRTADGPRYKALGNSMAVPVIRWLGQQIQHIHDLEARAEK